MSELNLGEHRFHHGWMGTATVVFGVLSIVGDDEDMHIVAVDVDAVAYDAVMMCIYCWRHRRRRHCHQLFADRRL